MCTENENAHFFKNNIKGYVINRKVVSMSEERKRDKKEK
jgi:hypothetical protein